MHTIIKRLDKQAEDSALALANITRTGAGGGLFPIPGLLIVMSPGVNFTLNSRLKPGWLNSLCDLT